MNEQIVVELILDDGNSRTIFSGIENQATRSGTEVGENLERGIRTGGSRAVGFLRTQFAAFAGSIAGLIAVRSVVSELASLETAFAEVATILPDVTDANDELRQSFLNNAGVFGGSATGQARAFYQVVSAGITDATTASETLFAANQLAIGGLTSTESAIGLLTTVVNTYGMENISAAMAADVLFGTVRLGRTTVEELSSSLGSVLPSAQALGVSFEDVSAALAALTTRGVSTGQATTQLNAIFTALLRNQRVAAMLGPEVADAFSLQSLETMDLDVFLRNLVDSLGGSNEQLVQLLGRVEGAMGIITLAGDDFRTLSNNISELENSTGAAAAAFDVINNTVGQQASRIVPLITSIFSQLASGSGGLIFGVVSNIASGLQTLNENFNAVAQVVSNTTRFFVSFIAATQVLPALIGGIASGISFLGVAFRSVQAGIVSFRVNLTALISGVRTGAISLTSFGAGLSSLNVRARLASLGLNVLRATVRLTGLALTLGLTLAIEAVIIAVGQLIDNFGGIGNVLRFVVLFARERFNDLTLAVIDFLDRLTEIPIIGSRIESALGGTFDRIRDNARSNLDDIAQGFDDLDARAAMARLEGMPQGAALGSAAPQVPAPNMQMPPGANTLMPDLEMPNVEEQTRQLEDLARRPAQALQAATQTALVGSTEAVTSGFEQQVNVAEVAWSRIAEFIGIQGQEIQATQEQLSASTAQAFRRIGSAAVEGLGRSFESVGRALITGENAFEAFGRSVLNVLGDIALQAGALYTALGFASGNFAQAALGIGLTVLGGAIKALAGTGGGSSPTPVSDGGAISGGIDSNPIDGNLSPINGDVSTGSQVSVVVNGDIFDSEETGLRISRILRDQGFQNAVVA